LILEIFKILLYMNLFHGFIDEGVDEQEERSPKVTKIKLRRKESKRLSIQSNPKSKHQLLSIDFDHTEVEPKKQKIRYNKVGRLETGKSFGELALMSPHSKRAATIRTVSDSYFAILDKDDFQLIYGKQEEKLLNQKIDFFKEIPLFAGWTRDSLRKLTPFWEEIEYVIYLAFNL
jgi:hypothetical protein